MYGQYTAGTWAYIGTQGILQGTYETFAAAGKRFPSGDLRGRIVLTAGLGGMGGAQPLAVKMAGGVCIAVEVDPARAERRVAIGLLRRDRRRRGARRCGSRRTRPAKGETLGIALIGNAAELFPALARSWASPRRWSPTRPRRMIRSTAMSRPAISLAEAVELRARDPEALRRREASPAWRAMSARCSASRTTAPSSSNTATTSAATREEAGEARAFEIEGFVPLFIRPSFCHRPRAVPLGLPVRRSRGPRGHRRGGARRVPRRRAAADVDGDGAGARADPGPAGALLLARPRRARPDGPRLQPPGPRGQAQGPDRDVARPSRHRLGGAADAARPRR